MQLFLQTATTVSITVVAVALVLSVRQLNRIAEALKSPRAESKPADDIGTSRQTNLLSTPAGYAVFVCKRGRWVLDKDFSNPGYVAIVPSISPAFEGQVVKRESGLQGV